MSAFRCRQRSRRWWSSARSRARRLTDRSRCTRTLLFLRRRDGRRQGALGVSLCAFLFFSVGNTEPLALTTQSAHRPVECSRFPRKPIFLRRRERRRQGALGVSPCAFFFFSVGNAEPLAASISSHPVWTKLLPIAVSLRVQIQSRFFSGTSANVCRFLMADGDEHFPVHALMRWGRPSRWCC